MRCVRAEPTRLFAAVFDAGAAALDRLWDEVRCLSSRLAKIYRNFCSQSRRPIVGRNLTFWQGGEGA
jgi:hypothetical protein